MPKPPLHRNGHRVSCLYCKRQLEPAHLNLPTSLTLDHIRAECDGGVRKSPCCRQCNFLKGNTTVEDWFWFIGSHPRWWKEFATPAQVTRIIREFRFAQAQMGQKPYRLKGRNDVPFLGSFKGVL